MSNQLTLKELMENVPVIIGKYHPLATEMERRIEEYKEELEKLYGQYDSFKKFREENNPNLAPLRDRLQIEANTNPYAFKLLFIIPEGIFYIKMGTYRLGGHFILEGPVKMANIEFLLTHEAKEEQRGFQFRQNLASVDKS